MICRDFLTQMENTEIFSLLVTIKRDNRPQLFIPHCQVYFLWTLWILKEYWPWIECGKNGKDVGISVDVTSVIHLTHWALYWTVCLSWCGCEQKILFLTMCKIKNKSFSQVHKCTWKNIKMFQLRLLSVFALIYV